jgi:hypothetical protein
MFTGCFKDVGCSNCVLRQVLRIFNVLRDVLRKF